MNIYERFRIKIPGKNTWEPLYMFVLDEGDTDTEVLDNNVVLYIEKNTDLLGNQKCFSKGLIGLSNLMYIQNPIVFTTIENANQIETESLEYKDRQLQFIETEPYIREYVLGCISRDLWNFVSSNIGNEQYRNVKSENTIWQYLQYFKDLQGDILDTIYLQIPKICLISGDICIQVGNRQICTNLRDILYWQLASGSIQLEKQVEQSNNTSSKIKSFTLEKFKRLHNNDTSLKSDFLGYTGSVENVKTYAWQHQKEQINFLDSLIPELKGLILLNEQYNKGLLKLHEKIAYELIVLLQLSTDIELEFKSGFRIAIRDAVPETQNIIKYDKNKRELFLNSDIFLYTKEMYSQGNNLGIISKDLSIYTLKKVYYNFRSTYDMQCDSLQKQAKHVFELPDGVFETLNQICIS